MLPIFVVHWRSTIVAIQSFKVFAGTSADELLGVVHYKQVMVAEQH
jgi:hypothetical protein